MGNSIIRQGSAEHVAGVIAEIQRMKANRRDYIYPARSLGMTDGGRIVFGASDTFAVGDRVYTEWRDAEAALDALKAEAPDSDARIVPLGKAGSLPLNRTAESQLATRLGIPLRYVDVLRESGSADLAATNFRTLLARQGDTKFLVRTLDGRARAVLSNSYKVMDSADVFFAATEAIQQADAEIWKARVWGDGDQFELFAVSRSVGESLRMDGDYLSTRYHHWTPPADGGDWHYAAVRITNSETGKGGLSVKLSALRGVCNNTVVFDRAMSVVHLGRRQEEEGLIYGDDTRESEAKTVWLKLRDTIKTGFDADNFHKYMVRIGAAKADPIAPAAAEAVVAAVAAEYGISDERRAAILGTLFGCKDLTRFGLAQAVTFGAHAADTEGRGAEASALEETGGKLLEMEPAKFRRLAEVGA